MDNCVRCGLLEGIGLQSTVNPPLPSLHTQNKTWPKFSLTVLDMFNHGRLLHDANKVGIYKELLEDINGMPTSLCFFLHNTWLTCLAVQPRWMYLRYKKTPQKNLHAYLLQVNPKDFMSSYFIWNVWDQYHKYCTWLKMLWMFYNRTDVRHFSSTYHLLSLLSSGYTDPSCWVLQQPMASSCSFAWFKGDIREA